MSASGVVAVSRLRMKVNLTYFAAQFLLDIGLPVAYAITAAATAPQAGATRLAVGVFILTATLSMMRTPASFLLYERLTGVRELLSSTGVTSAEYLGSNLVSALYFMVYPVVAYLAACFILHASPAIDGATILALVLYAALMHGFALLLSSVINSVGAMALTSNLLVLITAALCPLYYPAERVPEQIWPLVEVLPGSLAIRLFDAPPDAQTPYLLLLAVWTLVIGAAGYALALKRPSR